MKSRSTLMSRKSLLHRQADVLVSAIILTAMLSAQAWAFLPPPVLAAQTNTPTHTPEVSQDEVKDHQLQSADLLSPYKYKAKVGGGHQAYFDGKFSRIPGFTLSDASGSTKVSFTLKPDSQGDNLLQSLTEKAKAALFSNFNSPKTSDNESPGLLSPDSFFSASRLFNFIQDFRKTSPSLTENKIEYPVLVQGIPMTLRYTVTEGKVKEDLVIKEMPEQLKSQNSNVKSATQNLNLENQELKVAFDVQSNGLKMHNIGNGGYELSNDQGETYQIIPPNVKDSKGSSGEIKGELKDNTYSLILNTSYLKEASYPITIDPTVIINTSSGTASAAAPTNPSTMRHIVRTSDGTLHSFIQVGSQTATCTVGGSKSGLLWFTSADSGTTWTCQNQISSTTNLFADVRVDSSDNIHFVYSQADSAINYGAGTTEDIYYNKLTVSKAGNPWAWTLGTGYIVRDGDATTGYLFATLELEGTTRIWLAYKYATSTVVGIPVYYSNGLSPTQASDWTVSQADLGAAADSDRTGRYPTIVRFGSKIGVIYSNRSGAGVSTSALLWRYRSDSDSLTSWSNEGKVGYVNLYTPAFSAVGDSAGHIYIARNGWTTTSVYFNYYNGSTWSADTTLSATGSNGNNSGLVSVATDGTNAWVFYGETSGLSNSLSGYAKLVYKKCAPPFTSSDCDATATSVVSYHDTFDKVWTYKASAYSDQTTAAGNSTQNDVTMPVASGDIMYFGKTSDKQFDAISWAMYTSSGAGAVTWEYCSAVDVNTACTTWSALTFTASSNTLFNGNGWGAFTPPADWVTAKVNSEATAYYYIRARLTSNFNNTPVGNQMDDIPAISNANVTSTVASNSIYTIWTENAAAPTKVRYSSITVTPSTSPTSTAGISPTAAGYSSTTAATGPSIMLHIVRTSDGTLHTFIQGGTQLTCGGTTGSNNVGLNWVYSTDSGSTWICGGQLSSDTTNIFYADARVDSSDNIYVVYSTLSNGASTAYDVVYRKLTKGTGSTWTFGNAQTVLDGTASVGYSEAVLELEGTSRLWLAARYYNGTNYRITVYYTDGLTATPTWTQSIATVDTPDTTTWSHFPLIVRFGSKIGVIYGVNQSSPSMTYKWRYRSDSDSLTSWVTEAPIIYTGFTPSVNYTSAIGDTSGHIALAINSSAAIQFAYYNGTAWTVAGTPVSSTTTNAFVSLAGDGTNIWLIYGDITSLSSNLSGSRKLVYKKAVPPFGTTYFDSSATSVVSQHSTFDKYWSYVSSAYTDDTTDAGDSDTTNTASSGTGNDVQMVTGVGDIAYFGKTAKFDTISWALSTNGAGGQVVWEYYNGSAWMPLTAYYAASNTTFAGNGYITFDPHTDWATTQINSESTAYYYVRARVTTAYTTAPVGTQFDDIPQINYANTTSVVDPNGKIHILWTENAASPTKIRYSSISVATTTSAPPASIAPTVAAYSSGTTAIQVSTMKNIVRTSDGTLHAFIQAGTQLACGNQTGNNNNGLNWLYSTDSGSTWTCGGQLSSDTTNLMYADARVDSSDNIYVVYSVAAGGGNIAYNVYYRKLTKGTGSTWTLSYPQNVLNSTSSTSYSYSTLELEGTTRIWLATRYYDGTNYQISVYYSDGLSNTPTWTKSTATLETAGTDGSGHYPIIVRYGSKIGIIYNTNYGTDYPGARRWNWYYRADSDALTSWTSGGTAMNGTGSSNASPTFSAVGTTSGKIFAALDVNATVYFAYYNGSSWAAQTSVSTATPGNLFVSLATDGTNVWVFHPDNTSLSSSLSGSRKLVYQKGTYNSGTDSFTFDATATAVVSQHSTFDKYWSYVSSAYTDDTTDAGDSDTTNTASSGTGNDVQMVSAVGDIAYFGKTAKFDAISWVLSVSGIGGKVVWEYYNGSAWMPLPAFYAISNSDLTANGYITFDPPTDWATTQINSESTAYYYVRARVTTVYTTAPVGTQFDDIPQINWASAANSTAGLFVMWTENAASPTRVRFATVTSTSATNCNWTSASSTSWNSASNWDCGRVPTAADAVTFSSAKSNTNVTLDVNVNVNSINLGGSYTGTFTQGSYTMTVGSGGFTESSGTFTGGSGTITINGPYSLSGGTFTSTSGTLSTLGDFVISGSPTFSANSGTITLAGTNSALNCGSVTLNNLTLNKTGYNLTPLSNCTLSSLTLTQGTIANPSAAYTYNITGSLSDTTTTNIGGANLTVNLNGTGSQNISKSNGFLSSIFQVNKASGTAALLSALTTSGQTCTVSAGTFDLNGKGFTCGSTFTVQSGGTLQLVGSETSTTPTLNSGSTVTLKGVTGTGSYTIPSWSYSNLTINAPQGSNTFAWSSGPSVGNNLTVTAGTLNLNGNNLSVTGTLSIGANGNFQLQGGETTATPTLSSGSTVTFNGTGTYTLPNWSYSNLTVNGSGTFNLGATLTTLKSLTVSAGTLDATASNLGITVGGNLTNNATLNLRSNTVTFNDNTQNSVITGSASPAITFNNLTVTTASKILKFGAGQTFRINGLLTVTGSASNQVNLVSATPGTQWTINEQGTNAVTYAFVQDSACSGNNINLNSTSRNGGNNGACWLSMATPIQAVIKGNSVIKGNTVVGAN